MDLRPRKFNVEKVAKAVTGALTAVLNEMHEESDHSSGDDFLPDPPRRKKAKMTPKNRYRLMWGILDQCIQFALFCELHTCRTTSSDHCTR